MSSKNQAELFDLIIEIANEESAEVYLVGGVVRDLLLVQDSPIRDYDFLVSIDSSLFAQKLQSKIGGELKAYPKFLTAKVVNSERFPSIKEIDFVSLRQESYEKPGALPTVSPGSLESDLNRRDFTVNSLAIKLSDFIKNLKGDLKPFVIDYNNGVADLNSSLIKVLHKNSFQDDPTRIFRAVKYKTRFNFQYDEETKLYLMQAIEKNYLDTVEAHRVKFELKKLQQEENIININKELSLLKLDEYLRD